jgi:hypothetical protein
MSANGWRKRSGDSPRWSMYRASTWPRY